MCILSYQFSYSEYICANTVLEINLYNLVTANINCTEINDLHCLETQNFLSTDAGHVSGPPNSIYSIDIKQELQLSSLPGRF